MRDPCLRGIRPGSYAVVSANQVYGRGLFDSGWKARAVGSKNANTATSQRIWADAAKKSTWSQQFRKDHATSQRIHADKAELGPTTNAYRADHATLQRYNYDDFGL